MNALSWRPWGMALLLTLVAPLAAAPRELPSIRVCVDDAPHAPWRVADADGRLRAKGLEFEFLRLLGERGWRFQIPVLPWRRCLSDAEQGELDAVMAVGFAAAREAFMAYPMRDGQPDPDRAVRNVRYVVLVPAGSSAQWNGPQLQIQGGRRIGIQSGYSTANLVRELGFEPDDAVRTARGTLERMFNGQVQAVVLSQTEVQHLLEQEGGLRERVRELSPGLPLRTHYLGLAKGFARRHAGLAERLWDDVARVRESAEFRSLLVGP